ncbi:MAG TPA: ABC transporter permease subunit [Trebonia sp.]|jgi:phosphate transport system permease protein|nr:ABC transporter permease subunit [Trebonia sp.]
MTRPGIPAAPPAGGPATAILDAAVLGPAPLPGAPAPRTTLPDRSRQRARPPQPRPLSVLRVGDGLSLAGAAAAALALAGVLWFEISPLTGILGYVVVAWCLFVVFYAVLVSFDESLPAVADRVSAVVVTSLGLLVFGALAFVIGYTVFRGYPALLHANFYTQDLRSTLPTDPVTKGGVLHALLGTLIETGIAMAIAVPFGIFAGVFISEVPSRLSRFVRTIVEAMTALPDVLAGLFIYATYIVIFTHRPSGMAAAIALAITAIPIVCRATDVVLRLVPGGLTEASYALGAGQWRTVRLVTLPTVRSGLTTAVILGAARAIGETAPVLLTAGESQFTNLDPLHGPMMSLPLLAYTQAQSPEPSEVARGFGTAVLLLVLVVGLFAIARAIGGRGPGQLSAGQLRRRGAASRRDLARYERRASARAGASLGAGLLAHGSPDDGEG